MRWAIPLLLLGLTACDDTLFGIPVPGTGDPPGKGFCGVQGILSTRCAGCHSATAADGGLDLATDPHGALVDQPATIDPALTRVAPGRPEASFLLAKLEGDLDAGQGGSMPPGAPLDAASITLIRGWIADGAPAGCDDEPEPGVSYYPHPDGWAEPDAHGIAFKLREDGHVDFCTDCHGADLTGSTGPSCDSCHEGGDAWRTDCTFCHGGDLDTTGAPPHDLDNATVGLTFPPHPVHVQAGPLHPGWACSECHRTPTDVLSPGHTFVDDATPGVAEVVFVGGRSDRGTWTARTGTCSELYCHGSGQGDDGTIAVGAGPMQCRSCHPDRSSGERAWDEMSGEHDKHLRDAGAACHDCHGPTTADSTSILDVSLHIDGRVQVDLPAGISRSGLTCNGACHGETHSDRDWD